MSSYRKYTLPELLDRIGLNYDLDTGKMDCPFCGKAKKIHITESKKYNDYVWRCPICNLGGGTLHFYAMYVENASALPDSKSELKKLSFRLAQYMGDNEEAWTQKAAMRLSAPKRPSVPIALDSQLSLVYNLLSSNPALKLLPKHRELLQKRGLSDEVIDRNGYRSIPADFDAGDYYRKLYMQAGGESLRSSTKSLRYTSPAQIQLGLMLAHSIIAQGIDVQGVPGFFKFGTFWCFWTVPGILIPTRNPQGDIVIWQIRKDHLRHKKDAKYITVSKQELPGHVTEAVSRCHFPIANAPINTLPPVLITEGPLKADIAAALINRPVYFLAIPGISTTKDAYDKCKWLKAQGVNTIINALDMDRITNPNVRKGSEKINSDLREIGFSVTNAYWGEKYAQTKLIMLLLTAKLHSITLTFSSDDKTVFDYLNKTILQLEAAHIPYCFPDVNQPDTLYYWESKTKGIDDFCFSGSK